jgi:hypothetical protein
MAMLAAPMIHPGMGAVLFVVITLACPLPWFCCGAPSLSLFRHCHLSSHCCPPCEQLLTVVGAGAGLSVVGSEGGGVGGSGGTHHHR